MFSVWLAAALAADPSFSVGSYGRVSPSTDLEGGRGESFNLATHGPRLEKDPYLEIDLGWTVEPESGGRFEVLVTPAVSGDLFHYDGAWGDALAVRNLYALAAEAVGDGEIAVWAGARMLRGDDVYLLDFWPLDDQNTWGGGLRFTWARRFEIAPHVGVNRLGDGQQFQTLTVATPGGVAGDEVLVLDRQRTVATLRIGQEVPVGDRVVLRARVYGELHRLPDGERVIEDPFMAPVTERLPEDRGALVGLQLSAWGWAPQSFAHLWVRRETGLATWDELALPVDGLSTSLQAKDARGWKLAWAGNHELGPAGLMLGGYWRDVSDADAQTFDFDDRTEVVVAFRPQAYPTERTAVGVELSQQEIRPRGPNPRTDRLVAPSVTKFSVLPAIQVAKGGFSRPRLHLVYTATWLDGDARSLYDPRDARVRGDGPQHFAGIGAEWWLASRSYAPSGITPPPPPTADTPTD